MPNGGANRIAGRETKWAAISRRAGFTHPTGSLTRRSSSTSTSSLALRSRTPTSFDDKGRAPHSRPFIVHGPARQKSGLCPSPHHRAQGPRECYAESRIVEGADGPLRHKAADPPPPGYEAGPRIPSSGSQSLSKRAVSPHRKRARAATARCPGEVPLRRVTLSDERRDRAGSRGPAVHHDQPLSFSASSGRWQGRSRLGCQPRFCLANRPDQVSVQSP